MTNTYENKRSCLELARTSHSSHPRLHALSLGRLPCFQVSALLPYSVYPRPQVFQTG